MSKLKRLKRFCKKIRDGEILPKPKPETNLLKIFQPIHFILKFVIPIPYHIKRTSVKLRASHVKHTKLYGLVYLLIGAASIVLRFFDEHDSPLENAEMRVNLIAFNIFLLAIFVNRIEIVRTLNKIRRLEEKLKEYGYQTNYRRYVILVWFNIIFFIIARVALHFKDFEGLTTFHKLHYFAFCYVKFFEALYFYYIATAIMIVNNSLNFLTSFLTGILENPNRTSGVQTVRNIYSEIYGIVGRINSNYGVPITIICLISFTNSTTTLYDWWLNRDASEGNVQMLLRFIIHILQLLVVVLMCDYSKRTGEKMQRLLYKINNNETSIDTTEDFVIFQFLIQTTHEKIQYWACNMFPIDRSLISSVVVAGTTYSILLVQLGNIDADVNL